MKGKMKKNQMQHRKAILITSLGLAIAMTPLAMFGATDEQKLAKLECSVVKQAKSDCLTVNNPCMGCYEVPVVGVGNSWDCGCFPPPPGSVWVPLKYEKLTYTVCRQHLSDTCEDDKSCIYCVKSVCGKWAKPNVIIPPGTPGDMDRRYYECGWRLDIMKTMGFSVDCCYGKTIEDVFTP